MDTPREALAPHPWCHITSWSLAEGNTRQRRPAARVPWEQLYVTPLIIQGAN